MTPASSAWSMSIPDPNAQMNVWLSSAANHQWNPGQKTPATPWEAEIDTLMRAQASGGSEGARRKAFGRVQEIVAPESPFHLPGEPRSLGSD